MSSAALLVTSLLAAVASPPANWAPDVRAAREFAATRTGAVSFHVRTEAEHWASPPIAPWRRPA